MHRVIAYIDGFNLYFGLKSKLWQRYYWLDVWNLSRRLLKPSQHLVFVKYFTARISSSPNDPEKLRRQTTYLEALSVLPDFRIFYGHYLEKPMLCRKCGARWSQPEEKGTDVNIAVEIIVDAFNDSYDTALLISGDSDLVGPVSTVKRLFPHKRIVTAFPPNRKSVALAKVSDGSFVIGRGHLKASQFPECVTKPDGFKLLRPRPWR